jgi:uncharacterized protein YndB with AHSA1/START domain
MTQTTVQPVVREMSVGAPIDTCFTTFVDGFGTWWPPEHHIGDRTVTGFFIERKVGGRCYDVDTDGGECQWGTVLELDPPDRLVYAWHIQGDWSVDRDPALQSEVVVTFEALGDEQTVVRIEHRNLERHGAGAQGVREGVDSEGGWTYVLGRFVDVAEGKPPRSLRATA